MSLGVVMDKTVGPLTIASVGMNHACATRNLHFLHKVQTTRVLYEKHSKASVPAPESSSYTK